MGGALIYVPLNLPAGTQKNHEELVRLADVPAEIRTEHFPNVKRYHCTPISVGVIRYIRLSSVENW
jgi:hypothetical protein